MLAIRIDRPGGPDALTPVDTQVPEAVGDDVLVRNAWIGVNYVDLQHRTGSPRRCASHSYAAMPPASSRPSDPPATRA